MHYHFSSKAELGAALVQRYHRALRTRLDAIEREHPSSRDRIVAFTGIYAATQQRDALCLCGSLASEIEAVPGPLRAPVDAYMRATEGWLKATFERGVERGEFAEQLDSAGMAAVFLTALQGALTVAHVREPEAAHTLFESVRSTLLATL